MSEEKREHMPVTVELLKRNAVESSALRSYGYEPTTQTLDVEFTPPADADSELGGAVWRYVGVPPEDVEALVGAESVGKAWGLVRKRLADLGITGAQVAGPLPKKRKAVGA